MEKVNVYKTFIGLGEILLILQQPATLIFLTATAGAGSVPADFRLLLHHCSESGKSHPRRLAECAGIEHIFDLAYIFRFIRLQSINKFSTMAIADIRNFAKSFLRSHMKTDRFLLCSQFCHKCFLLHFNEISLEDSLILKKEVSHRK